MSTPHGRDAGRKISNESIDNEAVVKISNEVMVAAVIFLFMVVVFVFFLYLYVKRYWGATAGFGSRRSRSRARLDFVPETGPGAPRRGLDATVLESISVTVFHSSEFDDGVECTVCLSEIADGEKARFLPKCKHGFHVECIDMWFHSHSTCPLCRAAVGAPDLVEEEAVEEVPAPEMQNLPTNVLFGSTPNLVSTGASLRPEAELVIEIPRRAMEWLSPTAASPLPTSRMATGEMKSPEDTRSPGSTRLRSLRRLLSRGSRAAGPSCSPRGGGDVEQGFLFGEASATTPKTPTTSTVC